MLGLYIQAKLAKTDISFSDIFKLTVNGKSAEEYVESKILLTRAGIRCSSPLLMQRVFDCKELVPVVRAMIVFNIIGKFYTIRHLFNVADAGIDLE